MIWPLIVEALEALLGGGEAAGGALEGVELLERAKAIPQPLKSSALAAASFHDGTLTITMHDGTVLVYGGVPEDVYDGLMDARSPGAYFNLFIRGSY
jgi:hypothetical protein